MFNNKIKHIFIINLEESIERKKHMQILFKKYKINNYSFFKAISYKSDFIKNVMNTNFIAKYPPCFRCHKNECNCSNNMLINKQVANFFSFINLMKIIQKRKIINYL